MMLRRPQPDASPMLQQSDGIVETQMTTCAPAPRGAGLLPLFGCCTRNESLALASQESGQGRRRMPAYDIQMPQQIQTEQQQAMQHIEEAQPSRACHQPHQARQQKHRRMQALRADGI